MRRPSLPLYSGDYELPMDIVSGIFCFSIAVLTMKELLMQISRRV